jgi:apolipoprotein N-acyltransferase
MPPVGLGLLQDLLSLGRAQLGAQVAASTGLETQAMGIMGFDAAVAAIVVSVKGAAYLWVASLWLLAISIWFAILTILAPEPKTGQNLSETLKERDGTADEEIRQTILQSVADAIEQNRETLNQKAQPVISSIIYMALGITVAVIGKL